MRRIAMSLLVIAIVLSANVLPPPAQSCDWSEKTVMEHVEDLFYLHTSGEGQYPVNITKISGGVDSYALGFTVEPDPVNPETIYWITLYIRDYNA